MSIHIVCPVCGEPLRAPDDASDRIAKCPRCGERVRIPATTSMSELSPRTSTVPATPQTFKSDLQPGGAIVASPMMGQPTQLRKLRQFRRISFALAAVALSLLAIMAVALAVRRAQAPIAHQSPPPPTPTDQFEQIVSRFRSGLTDGKICGDSIEMFTHGAYDVGFRDVFEVNSKIAPLRGRLQFDFISKTSAPVTLYPSEVIRAEWVGVGWWLGRWRGLG